MTNQSLPNPGEVWMLIEEHYKTLLGDIMQVTGVVHKDQPFLVTFISVSKIGIIYCGNNEKGNAYWIPRSNLWDWHNHFIRIYPPIQTWDEINESRIQIPRADDLRAQVT